MPLSDEQVMELLDATAADSPPMQIDADHSVLLGRRRVRRRRVTRGVSGLAAVVAVAVLAPVAGGPGLDLLTDRPMPAAPSEWTTSEDVELELFDQYTGNNGDLDLTLRRPAGADTFEVRLDGYGFDQEWLTPIELAPTVDVFEAGSLRIAVSTPPNGADEHLLLSPDTGGWSSWPRSMQGQDVWVSIMEAPRPSATPPEIIDVLYTDGRTVQSAIGHQVLQGEVRDSWATSPIVYLPATGHWGYLEDRSLSIGHPSASLSPASSSMSRDRLMQSAEHLSATRWALPAGAVDSVWFWPAGDADRGRELTPLVLGDRAFVLTVAESEEAWRDDYGPLFWTTPDDLVIHSSVLPAPPEQVLSERGTGLIPQVMIGADDDYEMASVWVPGSGVSRIAFTETVDESGAWVFTGADLTVVLWMPNPDRGDPELLHTGVELDSGEVMGSEPVMRWTLLEGEAGAGLVQGFEPRTR